LRRHAVGSGHLWGHGDTRGSKWWALTVAPALLFAVIYYFGDL
jgi:hypothetical protein